MARWIRRILFALCVVATLLVIAALVIRLSLEQTTMASLSPKDRAALEEIQTKRLNIVTADVPTTGAAAGRSRDDVAVVASQLKVAPFKAGTVAAAKAFRDEWESHKQEALDLALFWNSRRAGKRLPDDAAGAKEIRDGHPGLASFIAAFRILVAQEDYEIEAAIAGADPSQDKGIPIPNLLSIQTAAKILALQSCVLSREGKTVEAFEAAETIIAGSKTPGYSILVTQMAGIAIYSIGIEAMVDCARRCDDPATLRKMLERQNQLAPAAGFIPRDVPLGESDLIGIIREGQRRGIESNIQGMTGRQLFAEAARIQEEYLKQIVLPSVGQGSRRLEAMGDIETYRRSSVYFGARPKSVKDLVWKVEGFFLYPNLVAVAVPNFEEAATREDLARARFDLLRLLTAQRLFALEQGREPETTDALAPDYLPETPKDPFAEDCRAYGEQPFFYSIGPDRIDQRGDLRYDPSNGTMSAGDVFLER